MDEMEGLETENKSKITVLAQVLDMEVTSASGWIWIHCYVRFESEKGPAVREQPSQHNFMLRIPGTLIFPSGPSVVNTKPSGIMLPPSEKHSSLTWSLDNSELEEVLDCAWLELKPDSEDIMGNIEMIPSLADSVLPY